MRHKNRLANAYIILVLVFLYLPTALVVVYSFNISKSVSVWSGFTLDWYGQMAADKNLIALLVSSLRVGLLASVLSAVLGTLGAVSLHSAKGRFAMAARGLVHVPLLLPEIVLGVALMAGFAALNVQFGTMTLVASHSTFCIPYVFILVRIRLRLIDPAIHEAARDLGASRIKVFRTITLPLIAPAIGMGMLLAFAMSFDDVVISFFVSGINAQNQTLPPVIYSMVLRGITPKINALYTIILLVIFTVVGALQVMSYRRRKMAAKMAEIEAANI